MRKIKFSPNLSLRAIKNVMYAFKPIKCQWVNPFLVNVPIFPLKAPENQRFPCVFRVYEIETLTRNGLKTSESCLA